MKSRILLKRFLVSQNARMLAAVVGMSTIVLVVLTRIVEPQTASITSRLTMNTGRFAIVGDVAGAERFQGF
jgi:hypothetical protein